MASARASGTASISPGVSARAGTRARARSSVRLICMQSLKLKADIRHFQPFLVFV